ncbi:hypothetical protein FF1_030679 [Malus domestica]|uniref:Uncharacterized protein n=1 Tax=Malus domestica TaxID=3750 RepID=A0A498K5T1_MALDO|nr:hypothetical protein DVH24_004262 [Malus domestica]
MRIVEMVKKECSAKANEQAFGEASTKKLQASRARGEAKDVAWALREENKQQKRALDESFQICSNDIDLQSSASQKLTKKLYFQCYVKFYKKVKITHPDYDLDVRDDKDSVEKGGDKEDGVRETPID